jgi:hypothetical protein
MKLKFILPVLLFLVIGIASCKKNLEETPFSFLSGKTVFSDEQGLKEATLGVYQSWVIYPFWYSWYRFILAEAGSRYATAGQLADGYYVSPFIGFGETPSDLTTMASWPQSYQVIARANTVIAHANEAVSDTNKANIYIAEVRLLRAYAYFNLVRDYGAVPLITSEISSLAQSKQIFAAQSPIQDVYNFIIQDLQFAETHLPNFWTGSDLGRISAGAAKALLGKVYLTGAGLPLKNAQYYQLAVNKLSEIVGAGQSTYHFNLLPNFSDVFSVNNKNNQEIVFSFSYFTSSAQRDGSPFPWLLSPEGLLDGDTQPVFGLTQSYYNLFENTDTRRDLAVISHFVIKVKPVYLSGPDVGDSIVYDTTKFGYINKSKGGIRFANATIHTGMSLGKYDRVPRAQAAIPWSYQQDMVQIRFSDVILCLAEALNETGQTANAVALLNKVRARANASIYTVGTQEVVRNQIRKERRLELEGEFTTGYDIKRWGTLKDEIAAMDPAQIMNNALNPYSPKLELYPIPQDQMDANPNLKQNLGW